jgi:hypothetical protein
LFFIGEAAYAHETEDDPENVLPSDSKFGRRRFILPAKGLFNYNRNLYFSDFYCTGGSNHYIQLVVTTPFSDSDAFCEENLIKLDKRKNPFMILANDETIFLCTCDRKWGDFLIEIFCTQSININKALERKSMFKNVDYSVRKGFTKQDLLKNPSCSVCNLQRKRIKLVKPVLSIEAASTAKLMKHHNAIKVLPKQDAPPATVIKTITVKKYFPNKKIPKKHK